MKYIQITFPKKNSNANPNIPAFFRELIKLFHPN